MERSSYHEGGRKPRENGAKRPKASENSLVLRSRRVPDLGEKQSTTMDCLLSERREMRKYWAFVDSVTRGLRIFSAEYRPFNNTVMSSRECDRGL
jgi:hypothetical protein